ncbi:glycosyltransferase, partial [Patulibacter sp. S7RM1-6]
AGPGRPPVRVAIDTRGAADVRGVARYVRCLVDALRAAAGPDDEIVEVRGPGRRGDVDVFHSPWLEGALLRAGRHRVVTLHDVVPLKRRHDVRFRLRYLAIPQVDRVIVPTAAVADDVVGHLGVREEVVRVIHEAPDPVFVPARDEAVVALRHRLRLPGDFLLWVGSLRRPDPRKRVRELVAAPRRLPLVLVGPAGSWTAELAEVPGVHVTDEVDDADLATLYTAAHALLLPPRCHGSGGYSAVTGSVMARSYAAVRGAGTPQASSR